MNPFHRICGRRQVDRDMADELTAHLETRIEELTCEGVPGDAARRQATRELGNATLLAERSRDVWRFTLIEDAWQDLRYACRQLRRAPAFATAATLTLALGIGANAAIFCLVDALLRPPPFEHLDRIVELWSSNPQEVPFDVNASPADFLDWRRESQSFDLMAGWRNWYFSFGEPGASARPPESIRGVRVSPSFFAMLGVRPAVGRGFEAGEEQPGHDRVVLLTHTFWARRFRDDRAVVGRSVLIDGRSYLVIGILPRDFQFLQPDLDIWMPLTVDEAFHERESHSVWVFARLARGVTVGQAQSEMNSIADSLAQRYPGTNRNWSVKVQRFYPPPEVQSLRPALLLLFGAAGFVLLIACANSANLLMARAFARRSEIAVRVAIGASRARLVRQVLTESLVLAVIGGSLGTLFAQAAIRLIVPVLPHAGTNVGPTTFRAIDGALDVRVLAFTLLVALLTGIAFGLLPALQNTRPQRLQFEESSGLRSRSGRWLMVMELALSIVLLSGAGLLLESFWRLQRVDPGFRADHLLTMQVWLPREEYADAPAVRSFYDEVLRRVAALPGVRGASAISYRPFLSMGAGAPIEIDGAPSTNAGRPLGIDYRVVQPGFLRVIRQPLTAGRDFSDFDGPDAAGVAIVNEALARRFWPNQNAVGRRLRLGFRPSVVPWEMDAPARWLTVVGVVRDIGGLVPQERDQSLVYVSALQFPSSYMFLTVRTAGPPLGLAAGVRDAIRAVDPAEPVSDVRAMDDAIAASVPRFHVALLVAFALAALLLASVGVYGVTSYSISRRTREIGVRMALGARSSEILRAILREGLGVGLIATALGLGAAPLTTRMMASLLYGVGPTEYLIHAGASAALLSVALLATYVPARRVTQIDPVSALKCD